LEALVGAVSAADPSKCTLCVPPVLVKVTVSPAVTVGFAGLNVLLL
jgi:hypothetical protein